MSLQHDSEFEPIGANGQDVSLSFVAVTLITIAERRRGVGAQRCRLAVLHFETARLLHRSLHGALARHKLTDLQFATLVILFSTEPSSVSASVLADHAAVTRASMTDALDHLAARSLVTRTRDDLDRRVVQARITPAGQEMVDVAIDDYLSTAEGASRYLHPASHRELLNGYVSLLRALSDGADRAHRRSPSV